MRRLGIDARKLADFGIGSYLQGLLGALVGLVPDQEVVVLISPGGREYLPEIPKVWRTVEVRARGYSFSEHVAVPLAALRAGIQVLHVPHYVVPFFFPRPLVATVHDIIHVLFPEFLAHPLGFYYARAQIRHAIRRCHRVITPSQTTAADLRRLFGAPANRVRVVPNGIQGEFLAEGDEHEEAAVRQRLGVVQPYLLHVGNHKPHKNVEGVLKAFQLLVNDLGDDTPSLVLAGAFEPGGEIAGRVKAMGMEARVCCLGHLPLPALVAVYRGASAFLAPSLYEGFGLTVAEAMACGVPVVAGDAPAIREVAGDAVIRVNPRDVVALAAALRRVLQTPSLVAQLQERGRERTAHLTWQRAGEATLAVFRELLEAG